jgi:tetratricopeptide (TPR) repeat protein
MRSLSIRRPAGILLFTALIFSIQSFSVFSQTIQEYQSLKTEAAALNQQQKFVESYPILEKLIILGPDDAEVQFMWGFALLGKAANSKDEAATKQLRIKARNAFIRSRELGNSEPLVGALIASLPEDGSSSGNFSKHLDAEKAMREAEGFFAQGKMDEALANYQKALKLDPTIYEAALFSGDVYTTKENFEQAEFWYQKAIAINPDRETAYRYSATPLMKQQKFDLARDRYIESFITEPYSRFSVVGISQWAQATGAKLGHPKIDVPASVGTAANGDINISIGSGGTDDGSFAWTAYGMARATWQSGKSGLSENFKKAFPGEKEYRHSLAEEYEALKMAASILKERMKAKDNPVKKLHPQLEVLLKLYDDGLIEPYILLAKADRGIARDHPAYLKQNRDKLRQYVLKYVIVK